MIVSINTKEGETTFETNNINNPISNYSNSNLVKSSSLNFDPNSGIYVSNKIRLQNPADSLKVIFDAYRPSSSDIRVLYSLIPKITTDEINNQFENNHILLNMKFPYKIDLYKIGVEPND